MFCFQLLRYGPPQRLGGDAGCVGDGLGLRVGFRRGRSAHSGVGSDDGGGGGERSDVGGGERSQAAVECWG